MSLDAGSVVATLTARVNDKGFVEFDQKMSAAQARATAAEKRMSEINRRSEESQARLGKAAKVAAIGGLAVLGGVIYETTRQAVDFEKSMRNVNSIAKLNEGQYKKLSASVKELSGSTAQAPKVLADAMYQLVSSGFDAHDSLTILKSSAVAASAGLTDAATATEAVAGVLNAYHLKASDASLVSDQLFQTVNLGVISFEQLAHNIGQVLPFAASLGIGLSQVGASISTLTKQGLSGDVAITDLKNAMSAMLKPSKGLAKAIKETGYESGEALVKHLGFQGALEKIASTTDGSKKAIAGLFPNIRALTAVLDLTGKSAHGAESDLKAFGSSAGATQKVFAEQSKSAAFQWQQMKANLSAAAITVGSELLPVLNDGVKALGGWISHLQQTGELKHFGEDLASGLRTTGHVLGEVGHVAGDVAGAIGDVVGTLDDLLDLQDPVHLEAILAAVLAFKATQTIAPMVLDFASAIGKVRAASAAGEGLAGMFAALPLGGQIGLVSAAVAGLAGALVLLGSHEDTETESARHNAESHADQAERIRDVARAEQESANSGLAAQRADLDLADAKTRLSDATKKYGKHSEEYRRALNDERTAALNAHEANQKAAADRAVQGGMNVGAVIAQLSHLKQAQADLAKFDSYVADRERTGANLSTSPEVIAERAKLVGRLRDQTESYYHTLARVAVSDTNRNRLMSAGNRIATQNVEGVALLIGVMNKLPKKVQTKLLLDDDNALAAAGNYSHEVKRIAGQHVITKILTDADSARGAMLAFKAIVKGVPASKVVNIVANAKSKKGEVDELQRALKTVRPGPTVNIKTTAAQERREIQSLQDQVDALHGKTITITTVHRDVTQGGPKHARGTRTGGPQLAWIGEGRDPVEWVIPRDPQYRGRAIGLLMDAAKSILPGHAKGVKIGGQPVAAANKIPASISTGGVPFDVVQSDRDKIHGRYTDAEKKSSDLWRDLQKARNDLTDAQKHKRTLQSGPYKGKYANHDTRDRLAKDIKRLDRQHKAAAAKVPGLNREDKIANAALASARKVDERAKNLQTQINLARDAMDDANRRHDQKGYNTARTHRQARIGDLIGLLRGELAHVPKGKFSDYVRQLKEQLSGLGGPAALAGIAKGKQVDTGKLGGDYADAGAQSDDEQTAADAARNPSTFTKSEQDQLDKLNSDIALAQLTDTTSDDTTAETALVAFLGPLLESAKANPAARGGYGAITEIAGQLKSAQSDLYTLTHPDQTPDQEAQVSQLTEQNRVLAENARINAAALAALGGPGDIGTGGDNARAAVIQNNYMLHPADPSVLRKIGDAATAGISLQPSRTSPRERTGL